MIALQSLKYFIWDYCLTKLFDGFENNFKINTGSMVLVGNLTIGMKLSKIVVKLNREDRIYYNCIIDRINPHKIDGTAITFYYGSSNAPPNYVDEQPTTWWDGGFPKDEMEFYL